MPVVKSLERIGVSLLGPLDGSRFVELIWRSLSFLWLSVGQVALFRPQSVRCG